MTSPISPISTPATSPAGLARSVTSAAGAAPSDGDERNAAGFAGAVGRAVSEGLGTVGALEQTVTEASQQAAVGDLESVSDFMIATTEAQLATEITVAVRDRAITAFNDIMRMQI
jgi:flagellar hook-basal body complex protein FliE